MKPYRVLIFSDLQIPYHDERTLKAVEAYMADHHWDEVVYLGDLTNSKGTNKCPTSHN